MDILANMRRILAILLLPDARSDTGQVPSDERVGLPSATVGHVAGRYEGGVEALSEQSRRKRTQPARGAGWSAQTGLWIGGHGPKDLEPARTFLVISRFARARRNTADRDAGREPGIPNRRITADPLGCSRRCRVARPRLERLRGRSQVRGSGSGPGPARRGCWAGCLRHSPSRPCCHHHCGCRDPHLSSFHCCSPDSLTFRIGCSAQLAMRRSARAREEGLDPG